MGPRRCIYMVQQTCTIYSTRPTLCRDYQCAWSQGLLDQDQRPDQSGLLVSVERDSQGQQYFRVVELHDHISWEHYQRLQQRAQQLGANVVKVPARTCPNSLTT
jgi:Fe-S-cluster containining protein